MCLGFVSSVNTSGKDNAEENSSRFVLVALCPSYTFLRNGLHLTPNLCLSLVKITFKDSTGWPAVFSGLWE